MTQKLSFCLIFRDEISNLKACLESVLPWCDEFICVDSGSKDGSDLFIRELALKDHRLKYFFHEWPNSFATQRNYAISQATSDWILFLDADERLDQLAAKSLRSLTDRKDVDAYLVEILNYTRDFSEMGYILDAKVHPDFGYVPTHLHRLFRRGSQIQYQGRLHERVEPSLDAGSFKKSSSPLKIHHWGKVQETDRGRQPERLAFYEDLGRRKVAENPVDPQAAWEVGVILQKKGDLPEAEKYFRQAFELSPKTEVFETYYLLSLYQQGALERIIKHQIVNERARFFLEVADVERHGRNFEKLFMYAKDFSQAPLMAFDIALRKGRSEDITRIRAQLAVHQTSPGILDWLEGRQRLRDGRNSEAFELLLRAVKAGFGAGFKDFCIAAIKTEHYSEVLEASRDLKNKADFTLDSDSQKMLRLAEIKVSV